jgi:hypothetical protein
MLEQGRSDLFGFIDLLTFIHTEVLPDQIKQTYDGSITVQKNCVTFHIPELPFNVYNQNTTFQHLFSVRTQGIGFALQGSLQFNSTPFTLFFFFFYKYLLYPID